MSDIEDEIKNLKIQVETARRVKTKADLQRDNARATVDKITTRLKNEFEVNSLTEANSLLESIDIELQEVVNRIRGELHTFE